jgi:hypothetical protein
MIRLISFYSIVEMGIRTELAARSALMLPLRSQAVEQSTL